MTYTILNLPKSAPLFSGDIFEELWPPKWQGYLPQFFEDVSAEERGRFWQVKDGISHLYDSMGHINTGIEPDDTHLNAMGIRDTFRNHGHIGDNGWRMVRVYCVKYHRRSERQRSYAGRCFPGYILPQAPNRSCRWRMVRRSASR
jgi:hypothetical protein